MSASHRLPGSCRVSGWRLLCMSIAAYAAAQAVSGIVLYALIGFPLSLSALHARLGAIGLGRNQASSVAIGELSMFAVAWLLMHRRMTLREIGLGTLRPGDVGAGLGLVAVALLLSVVFGLLLHTGDVKSQVDLANRLRAWWEVPAIALSAGLAEEVLFRGYLLRGLLRLWPGLRWFAILVSSIAFALAHLAWGLGLVQFAFYILLGLVLGIGVVRRNSLWPAIVGHAAWDMLALLLLTTQVP